MDASCSGVLASLAVTISAPGVKSGAIVRIWTMGMTISAAFRGCSLGLETATLIFLIFWAPCAGSAQRNGTIHNAVKKFLCIRSDVLQLRQKPKQMQVRQCSLLCTA